MQRLAKTAVPQYSQHTKYELWAEMEKKKRMKTCMEIQKRIHNEK